MALSKQERYTENRFILAWELLNRCLKLGLKPHITDNFFLYFQVCDKCTDLKLEVTWIGKENTLGR